MISKIEEFQGKNRFLSNFYRSPFIIDGFVYETIEHFFHCMKTRDKQTRKWIKESHTAGEAKRRGRNVKLRPDWEEVKMGIMKKGLKAKFTQNSLLRQKLLETGEKLLEEGNSWGDSFWGVNKNPKRGRIGGENHLGRLLMALRDEL